MNMMSSIYKFLYNTSSDCIDYSIFTNILEIIPDNNNKIQDSLYNSEYPIVKTIKLFCDKANCKTFAISLSGGVDSMVLASIVKHLGYNIVALHINYNNRRETKSEQIFLEKWCHYNDMTLYIKEITDIKRNNSKRSHYEAVTKEIRFNFYKEILEKEGLGYILLAHHRDDIVENIFANVCRSRYILDLAVIRESTTIDGVTICRPMIDYYKDIVYTFAHENNIPYFKDTTPSWSVRGKYRNNIAPAIQDTFTQNVKDNLIELGKQSDEWNQLVNKEIIKPFLDTVEYTDKSVKFNIEKWISYPMCFWTQVFMRIFYRYGKNCPSRRSVQNFMNNISLNTCLNIAITNNTRCRLKNNWITIEFI